MNQSVAISGNGNPQPIIRPGMIGYAQQPLNMNWQQQNLRGRRSCEGGGLSWDCCYEKDAFFAVWSGWKALRIVVSSKIPFDVGMEGIVLLELENVFMLLLRDNRVRRVVKKGHVFAIVGVEGECLWGG